jgi:lipooligosaccharide transport system ATP-binding protein
MGEVVVIAQGLSKTYPARGGVAVEAVRGIGFEVKRGTCTGLLGPNGAGKSTTMRMLMGLTHKTGGSLTVFGTESGQLDTAQRKRVSLVPQDDNLDQDLTVEENLWMYGRFFGITPKVLDERVPQLLGYMQLEDKAKARVNQLSGGMKRRLTMARALVNDPDLIIMDEPTTGLDPQARVMIWQRILELKKQGKTILLTTHYMDEAQRLCDHIILIDHGKVLDEGSPKALIHRHVKPHVFDVSKPFGRGFLKDLPPIESEDVGDSVLFYVEDAKAFRKALSDDLQVLHRPGNMEDVFLKLTGRTLRE